MAARLCLLLLIAGIVIYSTWANDSLDETIDHILGDVIASQTDGIELPEIHVTGFSCGPGTLSDLTSVYRTGHSFIDVINDKELLLDLQMGFKNFTIYYPKCVQMSFIKTYFLMATLRNSFSVKIKLLRYDDKPGCYPDVKSVSVDPFKSFHSDTFKISFGPGILPKLEALIVKSLLRVFKFAIEKVISKIILKQSAKFANVNRVSPAELGLNEPTPRNFIFE